jgi:hypothetical protein
VKSVPTPEMCRADEDAAVEQDDGEPDPGQVLEASVPRCPGCWRLDVGPLQLVGRPGEGGELLLLGGEGLHDPDARDVLLDEHRDVGESRLDQPRDRVHLLSHRHADDEGDRQRNRVTSVSWTLSENISANATRITAHCTITVGAITRYCWTARTSEFAREMSWPTETRS